MLHSHSQSSRTVNAVNDSAKLECGQADHALARSQMVSPTSTTSSQASTFLSIMPGVGSKAARGLRTLGSALIGGLDTVGGYACFLNVRRRGLDQKQLDSLPDTEFLKLCRGLTELTR